MTLIIYNESGQIVSTDSAVRGSNVFDIGDFGTAFGAFTSDRLALYAIESGGAEQPLDIRHQIESVSGNIVTIRLRFQDAGGVWSDATLDNASGAIIRIMSVGL